MYKVGTIADMIVELMDDIDPYRGMTYEEELTEIIQRLFDDEADIVEDIRKYIESLEMDEDEEERCLGQLGGIALMIHQFVK